MNALGIVSEYNPFHNGHKFHIEKARQTFGADYIVCVMSGNFVQRGEPSFFDKFLRARMAVLGGADLVLELPTLFSTKSAEGFSSASVGILESLGLIKSLCFGAECSDAALLKKTAGLISSPGFDDSLLEKLKSGIGFAAARQAALLELDMQCAEVIKTPNNILGVEYIRALSRLNSSISPICIPRRGSSHDANTPCGGFSSASFLRSLLRENKCEDFSSFVPKSSHELMEKSLEAGSYVDFDGYEKTVYSLLRRLSSDDFLDLPDVSEGLHSRLLSAINSSASLHEFIERCSTKRYTKARFRRIALYALLGITKEHHLLEVPYIRPLAMNKKGAEILKAAKKTAALPILTKPAHIARLGSDAKKVFELERRFGAVYYSFFGNEEQRRNCDEYSKNPVVADNSEQLIVNS